MKTQNGVAILVGIGLTVGAGIAAVDNFASGGEVSPIVIVGMLLVFGVVTGMIWGVQAAVAAAIVWAFLPMAHVLKHMMGLPDTIHPNTYPSILKLGAFTFVITTISLGIGLAFRGLFSGQPPESG